MTGAETPTRHVLPNGEIWRGRAERVYAQLEPFGGTCRMAVAAEQIARRSPEEARRYVCIEADEDGRDYVPAVLRSLGTIAPAPSAAGQLGLFARAAG